jgi:hypothetical protein
MRVKLFRLQLSRHKGFDLQKISRQMNGLEAVVVSRPRKWGCPFQLKKESERALVIARYRAFMRAQPKLRKEAQEELAGKNLACWCKPGVPCHASVLLGIANARKASTEGASSRKRV